MELPAGFWDEVLLTVVRLLIGLACAWGWLVAYRILRRPKTHRTITLIPRSIVWFNLFWLGLTAIMSLVLIIGDAVPVTGAVRTLYGASIGWSLFGVVWINATGVIGSIAALEVLERMRAVSEENAHAP